ncbi:hypothetical protein K7X08_015288 [Anisodus acutangulus]|uniref:Uncharacterized protein n=1 Tax=Anisodus acutangulus TaxID=402998 RepID=A0A9Q1QVD9_9SOLA|nr:hypothetical protein K7X08_015288 [Anisodus acutangulus]
MNNCYISGCYTGCCVKLMGLSIPKCPILDKKVKCCCVLWPFAAVLCVPLLLQFWLKDCCLLVLKKCHTLGQIHCLVVACCGCTYTQTDHFVVVNWCMIENH